MNWFFGFIALFLSLSLQAGGPSELAATASISQENISQVVDQYYELAEMFLYDQKNPSRDCRDDRGSCFVTACQNVRRFDCDDEDEMGVLRRACRGSWGDSCLKISMTFLDRFEYDDNEEMAALANSCRGLYDNECISFTCAKLGRFECDDLEEIIAVNTECSGYNE